MILLDPLARPVIGHRGNRAFAPENTLESFREAVALGAVFSGHRDIARDVAGRSIITWPFQFIVPYFVPKDYDPKAHIAGFAPTPLLFFHSPEDQVIPYQQGEVVFSQAGEPKAWITTAGPQIATFNYKANRERLLQFFDANR